MKDCDTDIVNINISETAIQELSYSVSNTTAGLDQGVILTQVPCSDLTWEITQEFGISNSIFVSEIITSNLFTGEVEVTETEECLAEIETSKLYRNKTDDNILIDNVTMLEPENDEPSSIRLTTRQFVLKQVWLKL